GGDAIGGLTDGQVYYVVLDDSRDFTPADDISGDWIDLGAGHGLQTGDEVTYRAGGGTAVGGLEDNRTYKVEVSGNRIALLHDAVHGFDPASNISGDWIDLGADHGLQVGDAVIYSMGSEDNTAVGNLVDGETYYIAEVSGNAVRLEDSSGTAITPDGTVATGSDHSLTAVNPHIIHLDPSVATGTGHTFDIVDPRQVKIADTFLNATAENPVTLDLSDPAVYGALHSFTPYQRNNAQAISFSPEFDLDAERDAINLGDGHNLYTGQAVTYSKGDGPSLSIDASGDDYTFASAEAGSGGVVAGAAAEANTTSDSVTRAYIKDGTATDHSQLEVSALAISADHTARFDSQTDSTQASAVGFSGSWATNDIDSMVRAELGQYTRVNTRDWQHL
ncbi:MAG: hypothetical protein B5M56_00335, partial [Desulfococcus sp. 4484_241]